MVTQVYIFAQTCQASRVNTVEESGGGFEIINFEKSSQRFMAKFPGINHYLKPLLWDVNLSEEELEELLSGKKDIIRGVTSQNIYVKLLSSYNWYTILKITGKKKLREILIDDVIKKLKSKTLQQKYFYARSVLF